LIVADEANSRSFNKVTDIPVIVGSISELAAAIVSFVYPWGIV
jgi:hypothetical protein